MTTPTSTLNAKVVGIAGNIVSIQSDVPLVKNSVLFVHTGEAQLKGEILRVQADRADAQIYDETEGIRVGDGVEVTDQMLSAALGPGLLVFFSLEAHRLPHWTKLADGYLLQAENRATA